MALFSRFFFFSSVATLLLVFQTTLPCCAQVTVPSNVTFQTIPSLPCKGDSLFLICNAAFASGSSGECYVYADSISVNEDTIRIIAYYINSLENSYCDATDTIYLGQFQQGVHPIIFHAHSDTFWEQFKDTFNLSVCNHYGLDAFSNTMNIKVHSFSKGRKLRIEIPENQTGHLLFELFDTLGRPIHQQRLNGMYNQVLLKPLYEGLYFFQITSTSSNKKVHSGKVQIKK